jgi:signal transduction histidine kinase
MSFLKNIVERIHLIVSYGARNRGFIGPIPYVFLVRAAVCLIVLFHNPPVSKPVWMDLVLSCLPAFYLTFSGRAVTHPFGHVHDWIMEWIPRVLFVNDATVLISLTNSNVATVTDAAPLFWLPIFSALEYFQLSTAFLSLLGVSLFAIGITQRRASSVEEFARLAAPQTLYLLIAVTIFLWILLDRDQRSRIEGRGRSLELLLEYSRNLANIFDDRRVLSMAVEHSVRIVSGVNGAVAMTSTTPEIAVKDEGIRDYLTEISKSVLVYMQQGGEPVSGKRGSEFAGRKLDHPQVTSIYAVPLRYRSQTGILLLSTNAAAGEFNEHARNLVQATANLTVRALSSIVLFETLGEIGATIRHVADLDRELATILRIAHERFGFHYVTISLVDENRKIVEMVRAVNASPGWIRRSKHGLDGSDIQAFVCRTGETVVIKGLDPRLDPVICARFGHKDLARVWVPFKYGGYVIGTLCGGCHIDHADRIITSESISNLEKLSAEHAQTVDQLRPHILFEALTRRISDALGAEFSSMRVYQSGQIILQAATGDYESSFGPNQLREIEELGAQALREGTVKVDGANSVAAFPLNVQENIHGIWFVKSRTPNSKFVGDLEQMGLMLARQLEIVLRNTFAIRSVAEGAERARGVSELLQIVHSFGSSSGLIKSLDDLAEYIMRMFDADNVVLYQYSAERQRFVLPPIMKGDFRDPEKVRLSIGGVPQLVLAERESRFLADISPLFRSPGGFVEREGIQSSAALVLRVDPYDRDDQPVGLLFLNYRTRTEFAAEECSKLETLAASAAIAIGSARLENRLKAELSTLQTVDYKFVAESAPLHESLLTSLNEMSVAIGADEVDFLLLDPITRSLICVAATGPKSGSRRQQNYDYEGIIREATESSLPVQSNGSDGTRLAIPLQDDIGLIGVLNLEGPTSDRFTAQDIEKLGPIARSMAAAMRHYARGEQTKLDRCMSAVGIRIQASHNNLEAVLRLVLTGVTAGISLGFSRAALFTVSDDGKTLEGRIAVGSVTGAEAEENWTKIDRAARPLITDDQKLDWLLDTAVISSDTEAARPRLDALVRASRHDLANWDSAVARCVREGQTITLDAFDRDPWRVELAEIEDPGTPYPVVCVPLMVDGKAFAVLVVDRRFLSNSSISQQTIRNLERFARFAAVSIMSSRLRSDLSRQLELKQMQLVQLESVQQKLLASQIQTYAALAHELRTPLLNAGRTIESVMAGIGMHHVCYPNLAKTLVHIGRARYLTGSIGILAVLARDEELRLTPQSLTPTNLLEMLSAAVADFREINAQKGLAFVVTPKSFPPSTVQLSIDRARLDVAFRNVLDNCTKYSYENTEVRVEASITESGVMRICFTDEGIEVTSEQIGRCFEQGWRSERAQSVEDGSGLGLWITYHIVRAHNGEIEVSPTDEAGCTRVTISLPLGLEPFVASRG